MAPSIRLDKYAQRKLKKGCEYFFFRKVIDQKEFRRPLPHPFMDGYRVTYEQAWFECFGVPVEIKTSGTSVADLCTGYERYYTTAKRQVLPYYKNRALTLLKEKWARFEAADIKPIHMQALYDSLCSKPQVANRLFDEISVIFQWGIPRGMVQSNGVRAIERTTVGESYEPWPTWAIEKFIAESHLHLCRAFLVALYTGQRWDDVLKLKFGDIENGVWNLRHQGKTGNDVPIPLHPIVQDIVEDEWKWGKEQKIVDLNRPVLRNSFGKPWKSGFGASWNRELARLDLKAVKPRLTYHGLRTTNATIIASTIAKSPDLFGGIERVQSLLGHHSKAMSKHYARRAKQEQMNASSVVLLPDFGNRR